MMGFSMTQYMTSYYIHSNGMTIGEATLRVALISGFAGTSGTYLGGYLGSRVAERDLSRTSRVAAWGFIVAAPLFAFDFLALEAKLATALLMLGTAAQLALFRTWLFDLARHGRAQNARYRGGAGAAVDEFLRLRPWAADKLAA